MVDLDQSGQGFQRSKVYLGPSLGWVMEQVRPATTYTVAGTYTLPSGTSVVLAQSAGALTFILPSVRAWVLESAYLPATAFDRGIWIKDMSGNFATFNCTVIPGGSDKIDNQSITYTLATNYTCLRLYPLIDLTGWFVG